MKEVTKTTPILYKSIHIDKSLTEGALQLFVETSKYIYKDDTLDLSMAGIEIYQKAYL